MKKFSLVLFVILLLIVPAFAQSQAETYRAKAVRLNNDGKFEEAAAEISKAIALEPGNADLYLLRAYIYQFNKNIKALVEDVNKAVELDPFNKENIIRGTRYLLDSQQCERVITIVNEYILKNPQSDEAYDARFRAKTCLEDMAGAFEDISKAIELNPKSSIHRSNQANLLSRMGDSEKALELFSSVIAFFETNLAKTKTENDKVTLKRELAMLYITRAQTFERKEDMNSAVADLTKAVQLMPTDYFLRIRARAYRKTRKFAEAVNDYTEAIRLAKGSAFDLYLERGDAFMESGKYVEALQDYEQSLKLDQQLKEIVERRITLAREKIQAVTNQPK
ncbi:MAG TPA: tetratricopeptide repeat protein [Pyrinomonadaceae bacterium]